MGALLGRSKCDSACAAASNALAMSTKSEDVMAPVINVVMMPILLLSGILLPMTLGAEWLQRISDFMPFRYIVDAARDAFTGDLGSSEVMVGTSWAVLIFGLAMWRGATVFRKRTPTPFGPSAQLRPTGPVSRVKQDRISELR